MGTLVCHELYSVYGYLLTPLDVLIDELLFALVLEEKDSMPKLKNLVKSLHAYEQKSFLKSILRSVAKMSDAAIDQPWNLTSLENSSPEIAGSAAVLQDLLSNNEFLLDYLVELLINLESSPLIGSNTIQRAAVACIAKDEGVFVLKIGMINVWLNLLLRSNLLCHGKEYGTVW